MINNMEDISSVLGLLGDFARTHLGLAVFDICAVFIPNIRMQFNLVDYGVYRRSLFTAFKKLLHVVQCIVGDSDAASIPLLV